MAGISEHEQIDLLFKQFTNTVNANPELPFTNSQNSDFPFQNFEFSKNLFIDDIPENLDNITYNGLLGTAALDASFGVATDISYEIPIYPLLYYHRIELTNALDGLNNTSWYYPDPNNNKLSLLRGSIPFNYDPINFTYKQLLYSNSNQEEALNSDPLYWLFDYKSGFVQFYGDPEAVTNWVNTHGPPRISVIVYNGNKGLENFLGGGNVYNNLDVSGNISANNLFMNLRQDIGYNGLTQLDTINEAYNNELLGYSISLNNDGSIIVVSAPYALGSVPGSNFAGRVRVYRYNGTSWNIYGNYIEGTIENEYLGISVKINSEGNKFILGGLNKARVYHYNGSSWIPQGSDITGESNSYHIVSIDSEGNRIAVGEPKFDDNTGIVRIFDYDGLAWNEIETITGNNNGEYFGGIVELSDDGTKLAITSGLFKEPSAYKNIGSYNGKVTVYNYNGSSWNTYGDIINGNSGDLLGLSLALNSNGNTLVIGSPGNSNNDYRINGKVIIYNYDNENDVWINVKEITGQVSSQSLGSALSLSSDGKLLAISSAPDYINDGYNTTSNYYSPCKVELYHYSNNSWNQIYNAIVENNVEDILGGSVSLSKNGKILGIGVLGLYNVNTYNIYDYVYNEGEINFIANNENISKIISTYDGNESSIKFSTINNSLLEDRLTINKDGIDISGNINANNLFMNLTKNISYNDGTLINSFSSTTSDNYGESVSLSGNGNILIVSAPERNSNGEIIVYENLNSTWKERDIIYGLQGDVVGRRTAINYDGTVIAFSNPTYNSHTGFVKIYKYINSSWIELVSTIGNGIYGMGNNEQLGKSLAFNNDGNILVIGAPFYYSLGYKGKVEIYKITDATFSKLSEIVGEQAIYGFGFGETLALSLDGNILAIGCIYGDSNGTSKGEVQIYNISSQPYTNIGSPLIGESTNDLFGSSISLNNDGYKILIGASGSNPEVGYNRGSAYLYEYNSDSNIWLPKGNTLYGESAQDYFGISSCINSDGSIIVVGSTTMNSNSGYGYVKVYKVGTTIELLYKLTDANYLNNNGDKFGLSNSLSNDGKILAIGAYGINTTYIYYLYNYLYNGEINFLANDENISKIKSRYDGNESSIKFSTINNSLLEDRLTINKDGIDISGNLYNNGEINFIANDENISKIKSKYDGNESSIKFSTINNSLLEDRLTINKDGIDISGKINVNDIILGSNQQLQLYTNTSSSNSYGFIEMTSSKCTFGGPLLDFYVNSTNSSFGNRMINAENTGVAINKGSGSPTHTLEVNGDIKGDNLFLGENGQTPKIDMLFTGSGSSSIYDTRIEIGKSDDFYNTPASPPLNAYGMNIQANSDALFVGTETYDSGNNWRPLLKWGDDSTDTPFTIHSHVGNHKWEFGTDGRLVVPNVVKGAQGTVCKIHILPFTDNETANTSSTSYNSVVGKFFTKTGGTNLFGEVSVNYTISGFGSDTFDARLVFSNNPNKDGDDYNIVYAGYEGGGNRSGDINGAAVYTNGTGTNNSGLQGIYLQARRTGSDDTITFKAGFFKVTELWS